MRDLGVGLEACGRQEMMVGDEGEQEEVYGRRGKRWREYLCDGRRWMKCCRSLGSRVLMIASYGGGG